MRYLYFFATLLLSCSRTEKPIENDYSSSESMEQCDSIPQHYIKSIKFPFLRFDSLNEADIDAAKYLKFGSCDNRLFKNNRTDVQTFYYISLQDSALYYEVLVFRQMDMENCIFVYSIDKDNKVVDSKLLFCESGGLERRSNVIIDGKILNTISEEKKALFSANRYISIEREHYSITDTLTNTTKEEVGKQKVVEFQLEKDGRYKIVRDDSFEKEYSKVKYWYD